MARRKAWPGLDRLDASASTGAEVSVARRLSAGYRRRATDVIATSAALLGILAIITAAVPGQRDHLQDLTGLLPMPATAAAASVTALSGLLLLRVAAALRKRKRRAWRLAVAATSAMAVTFVVRERDPAGLVVSLILLGLLWSTRRSFTAGSDPTTRWFALRLFLWSLIAGLGYGLSALYFSNRVVGNPSFWSRLQEVLFAFVGVNGPVHMRGGGFNTALHVTLLIVGLTTLLLVALLILRPPEPVARLSPDEEERIRALLGDQGKRDSLGYFATRRDKSVVWSPTGKAAIAYRVVHGVALASGDPVGDPEAWPGAIAAYRRMVTEHGWTAAVFGCSELGATVFKREMGLSALALGDEAIVHIGDFGLQGRSMRGVRQACTRVERGGYEVRVRRGADIGPSEWQDVLAAAAAWRGAEVERGFSMALSRLGDPADGDCVLVTAYRDGALQGLLHFVPWGRDGLSLDLMRRDRATDNGLNEYLIVQLIEACPGLGIDHVSLNFAVFRDAIERGAKIGAGPFLRSWRRILVFASRWWQIESLYRFNVKFQPEWHPRLVSFPSARDLPRIVLAALEAEAFLVRPPLLRRLMRHDAECCEPSSPGAVHPSSGPMPSPKS